MPQNIKHCLAILLIRCWFNNGYRKFCFEKGKSLFFKENVGEINNRLVGNNIEFIK